MFGASEVDHGTAVAGIVVGADNGVGTIGIAPGAGLEFDHGEPWARQPVRPSAIAVAAANLGRGDILLLEVALTVRAGE